MGGNLSKAWGTEVLLVGSLGRAALGTGDLRGRNDEAPLELQARLDGGWRSAGWSSRGAALWNRFSWKRPLKYL